MLELQQPPTIEMLTPQPQALQALFMALQDYPDFVDGLQSGQQAFYDLFEEEPLTEEDVHHEIEEVLSQRNYDDFAVDLRKQNEHLDNPYFYLLGFVLGEINESYTIQLEAFND